MPPNKGFTLVEIILAVLLLAVAISPMLEAFAPAIFATNAEEETAVFTNRARATMNRVMDLDFHTLDSNQGDPVNLTSLFGSAEEAAKESFVLKGINHTPEVIIAEKVPGDDGLLEITVNLEGISFKTLKAEY